jgi:8-oxo-dGTP pyrophosphatase MutT (NUDIX family)
MFKISLAGCVIINNKKILLLQRLKTGWYELPGGKLHDNESPREAAKREFKEELKCDAGVIRKIGIKAFKENGKILVYHWFLAKIKNGQVPQLGEPEKFNRFRYIPITNISRYKLSPNMRNLVSKLKKREITLE